MRRAVIMIAISILATTAAAAVEPVSDVKGPRITILRVKVVKNPVITAEMLSPKLTIYQVPARKDVASIEAR
jgi:hypothetical protein